MRSTSNDVRRKGELVPAPSSAVSRADVEELIRRGLQDLGGAAQAEHFFSLAVTAWSGRDYKEAVGLFRRCVECDSRHADAYFYLGLAYYRGVGVPAKDSIQAANCWRIAAEQGHGTQRQFFGRGVST